MNVNDSIKNNVDLGVDKQLTSDKTAQAKPVENKSETAPSQDESVTLSSASVQLQSIQSDLSTKEVFDADKVEAIKAAISNGEFTVNAEKVADGLIDTVKDLFKAK